MLEVAGGALGLPDFRAILPPSLLSKDGDLVLLEIEAMCLCFLRLATDMADRSQGRCSRFVAGGM